MGALNYLFSFRGRINRAKLWLFLLVGFGFEILYAVVQIALLGPELPDDESWDLLSNPRQLIFAILCVAITIPFLWANGAVLIKRLHDRNRSAWWLLVFYVLPFGGLLATVGALQASGVDLNSPIANTLLIAGFAAAALLNSWGTIELYFLRGAAGDNRYGPDPLTRPV